MTGSLQKFYEDFNLRLISDPKSVSVSLLVKAIPIESERKCIPAFVKREICRLIRDMEAFSRQHPRTKSLLKSHLLDLLTVVKEVKPNHEGYVRAALATFRSRCEKLRSKVCPPQKTELIDNFKEKLRLFLEVCASYSPLLEKCETIEAQIHLLAKRVSDLHSHIPRQQYKVSGINVLGAICEPLDIPEVFSKSNAIKNNIQAVCRNLSDFYTPQQIETVELALKFVEVLLKMDATWLTTCCSNIGPLLCEMKKLVQEKHRTAELLETSRKILATTIPSIRICKEWIKLEELTEEKLKRDAMSLTPPVDYTSLLSNTYIRSDCDPS